MSSYNAEIKQFLDACIDAGIKHPELFLKSKMPQVFDWLKGCFPRGILPTDVDGEVEINGNFLRLEFKHDSAVRSGDIPKGQLLALQRLVNAGPFTVFLIGINDCNEPTCYQYWHHNEPDTPYCSELKDGNREDIRSLCKRWVAMAEKNKRQ